MSYYRNFLEDWLKTIDVKTEKVLDLGGASNPVAKRVRSFNVGEVTYLDNGAEEAKETYINFDINLPWREQLKAYGSELQKSRHALDQSHGLFEFDAIFCLEVFEYVWHPVQAFTNIWEMMSPDSVCYLSFPSVYPVHKPYEIDYLRYTKQAIKRYLALFPFTDIEIIGRPATLGFQSLSNFYKNEQMHPLKHSLLAWDIGYLVKARKLALV